MFNQMDVGFQHRFVQMLSKLKENSLRVTPQRLAVLKILAGSPEHPTVEAIHEQVKKRISHDELGNGI